MLYKIYWENSGVIVRFTGSFTAEENRMANAEVLSDKRSESVKYAIWDLLQVDEILMNTWEMEYTALVDVLTSPRIKEIKLAFVCIDEEAKKLFYEYSYHSKLHGSKWQLHLSESIEEAKSWISSSKTKI